MQRDFIDDPGGCRRVQLSSDWVGRSSPREPRGRRLEVRSAFGIDRHQAGQFEIAVVRAPYWLGNRSVKFWCGPPGCHSPRAAWRTCAARPAGDCVLSPGCSGRPFGNISNVRAEGGSGIVKARRERGDPPGEPIFVGDFGSFGFESGRRDVAVARHPAVFSDGVLDNASRMLIESLPEHRDVSSTLDAGVALWPPPCP